MNGEHQKSSGSINTQACPKHRFEILLTGHITQLRSIYVLSGIQVSILHFATAMIIEFIILLISKLERNP